jgi:hypothetical protein
MDRLILDLRGDGGNRAAHQSGLVDSTRPGRDERPEGYLSGTIPIPRAGSGV